MNEALPPDASFQLKFLREVQRILDEGRFVASYKFALMHALADLAVQVGDDSGAPLDLRIRDIGARFIELYWRQVTPWPGADEEAMLQQNTGRMAAVVRRVREARSRYGPRLHGLRDDGDAWAELVRNVSGTVRTMPLFRLQTVGEEQRDFLYANEVIGRGDRARIRLRPGIAYCFRAFYPLVIDLAQGGWARFLQQLNPDVLGPRSELREFLFGAPRRNVSGLREPLLDLQNGRCFYCRKGVRSTAHVDHFVPWARYPTDLGHNFVIAHDSCNARKSDHLAAEPFLERWVERNNRFAYDIDGLSAEAGVRADLSASVSITRWAYRQVADRDGQVWLHGREFIELSPDWPRLLHPVSDSEGPRPHV